jgi:hypothetical protein
MHVSEMEFIVQAETWERYVDMNTLKRWTPLLTAVISAIAVLVGYTIQKHNEMDAEIRETRQQIYSRLISNITERNTILGRLLERQPEYVKARPEEQYQVEQELSAAGRLRSAELSKNEGTRTEIVASLCLYGTDEAIDAYAKYAEANTRPHGQGGDLGELIVDLRRSISKTSVKPRKADLAIWNDRKYLEESASAK